jgi:glycosyltransferase involved in cell wall biosynthesis
LTAGPAIPGAPSIAVIVPNRNDSRHLPRCLRSVLEQEVGPEELIVIDDQSTDDSVAVVRSLVAGHAHAQIIENPVNLGVYGAVNEGLKRSRSEYALFLAANDFVLPGIFARAKACLRRWPGVGLWSAMAWLVDEEGRPIRLHPSAVLSLQDACFPPARCTELAYRFGNWFTGTTLIYRRDALDAAGRFDPAYKGLADLLAALTVASRHGAAYSPEPLAAMRVHAGSHLSDTLKDPVALEAMLSRLREKGPALAPQLFTHAFLERTARRFRFAALRAQGGEGLFGIALAFVRLRPFDILPALWNRALGWAWVRLRVALRGGAPR